MDLLAAVPRWTQPRVGVGGCKFTEYVSARFAEGRGVAVCPPDEAAFLTPMSIGMLPVSDRFKNALRGFGLRSIGQLAALPLDAIARIIKQQADAGKLTANDNRRLVVSDNSTRIEETFS